MIDGGLMENIFGEGLITDWDDNIMSLGNGVQRVDVLRVLTWKEAFYQGVQNSKAVIERLDTAIYTLLPWQSGFTLDSTFQAALAGLLGVVDVRP